MKRFLKEHESTLAIVFSALAVVLTITDGVSSINDRLLEQQSDYNTKLLQQQSDYNEKFNTAVTESTEKFTKVLESLHKVDKQAIVRDKELEIAFVKKKSSSVEK